MRDSQVALRAQLSPCPPMLYSLDEDTDKDERTSYAEHSRIFSLNILQFGPIVEHSTLLMSKVAETVP